MIKNLTHECWLVIVFLKKRISEVAVTLVTEEAHILILSGDF